MSAFSRRSSQETVTVAPGDSLYAIAARELDDASRWPELAELNRETVPDPRLLRPGQVLVLPGDGLPPTLALAARTYTVRAGDTLSAIAERLLGDPKRYGEIFDANRDVLSSPHRLAIGTTLKIPGERPEPAPVAPVVCEPEDKTEDEAHDLVYVGPGDTLWRIAERTTGDGRRWRELWELNREVVADPNALRVGTPLKLPSGWQAPAPREEEREERPFEEEVFRSLARYEGGDPAAVHYDSARVNVGKGSWTGGHIATLLDLYEQVAVENQILDELHGLFGGAAALDDIRNRFRRHGAGAWLSKDEENAMRAAGRHPVLSGAQDRKGAQDVQRYLGAIRDLSPSYPWLDDDGAISELGAMILCHAGHQSGSPGRPYDAVVGSRDGEDLRRVMSEARFLQAIADTIVSWVQPRYRQGVRNRYNWLFATYGTSRRHRL